MNIEGGVPSRLMRSLNTTTLHKGEHLHAQTLQLLDGSLQLADLDVLGVDGAEELLILGVVAKASLDDGVL